MNRLPPALIVLAPPLNRGLFDTARLERAADLCDLLAPEPVPNFADACEKDWLERVEVLITGWGVPRLDSTALASMPRLRAAFHAAGTVKNHVTPDCFARGIRVTSAAAANAIPVAEYTVGAILLANKRAFRIQRRYRELRGFRMWPREFPGLGNKGKVIGIVGASRIGRLVLERLAPFDFELLVTDPYLDAAEAKRLGARLCPLDELLAASDLVSLHAPALAETRHMIDGPALALLRDGAILVNTARGALVDHEALTRELVSGRIEAVIDTTEPELLPADSPLFDLENVFLTPHIAGSMAGETARMLDLALDELERFVSGLPLEHEVRAEDWDRIA